MSNDAPGDNAAAVSGGKCEGAGIMTEPDANAVITALMAKPPSVLFEWLEIDDDAITVKLPLTQKLADDFPKIAVELEICTFATAQLYIATLEACRARINNLDLRGWKILCTTENSVDLRYQLEARCASGKFKSAITSTTALFNATTGLKQDTTTKGDAGLAIVELISEFYAKM